MRKVFLAVLLLAMLLPGVGYSVNCTVDVGNDPDPVVSNTTGTCGIGGGNNDSTTTVADATGISGWSDITSSLSFTGTTGGNWFIDFGSATYSDLTLVLNDGNTGSPNPDPPPPDANWVWFDLDVSGACSIGGAPAGTDLCGTWSMWGNSPGGTVLKEISHMSLYGIEDTPPDGDTPPDSPDSPPDGDTPPDTPVSEPATLLLLGTGLLVMRRFIRKA
jgi:hypothetical protein